MRLARVCKPDELLPSTIWSPSTPRPLHRVGHLSRRWLVDCADGVQFSERQIEVERAFLRPQLSSFFRVPLDVFQREPKANFRMDFINPLLTQRRDYIIHLLDLRSNAPRLSAQTSARDPVVSGIGSGVIFFSKGSPAGSGEDARAAWLPQELSCCFVTCSGTVATIRSNGADAIDLLP